MEGADRDAEVGHDNDDIHEIGAKVRKADEVSMT